MNKTVISQENHVVENQEQSIIHHIINSISSALPGNLGAINENSERIFYEYIELSHIDRSAFSYNWPYIVQATRSNGFYYQTKQSIVYFYLRKNTNDSQPYSLIVVNHLGYNSEISVVINIEFSRRTKEIIRKLSKESNYVFVPYTDLFKNDGLKLLEKNSEYLENKGVDFKNEVMRAHQFVFDDNIKNKTILAILEDNRLIGLAFLTQVGDNLFFNAIINENKSNLMRFLLWKSVVHYCECLEEEKRPLYLALQGSENEGQTKWKVFFSPLRTIHRTHLTNKLED